MQRHPAVTERLLQQVAPLRPLAVAAAGHHERVDGRGYHRGVLSDELPRAARILAVADVFEAMTADRPYRVGMPVDQVLELMARDVGRAFEPAAFAALDAFVTRGGRLLAA
jgi:HD-GYP domain-containing protein (c-di-GMP phosphodiesterase class II)